MNDYLITHEATIRLLFFISIFALMALWEFFAPRRARTVFRRERWPSNLGLVALNTVLVRLVLPTSAVSLALVIEARHGGILPLLALPPWLVFILALVLLDLAIYLQHLLFHAVPFLWRLHRLHHADVDVDVTNGLRFHTFEIVLSMGIKFALIAALGAPAAAVLVFEVLLNGLAILNHANVHIPERIDSGLRCFIVTPDMHRIHHSWHAAEHNRNFGFNLTCWDRLFGTYLAQAKDGQTGMTLGLPFFREAKWRRLDRMLRQPLADAAPDHQK